MKTAKAGVIPWSQITDIHAVKQNSNVFIEMVITTQEADRQAAAGLGVAKPELCYWLEQEHKTRATV